MIKARHIALCLAIAASPAAAQQGLFAYQNIATQTTTTLKSGKGILHSICMNTPTAVGTAQIYDNTAASGTKIGLITSPAAAPAPFCQLYDVQFWTGLTIVTAGATTDITVTFR
jgi:hypothetical protein